MIETLKNIYKINMSNRINFLIYYFKYIPLIGRLLKDTVYKELKIKKIISIFVLISKGVNGFIGSIVYVVIAIGLPIFFLYKDYSTENKYSVFVYLLFVLSFMIGAFAISKVLDSSKEKFICVKLMKMRAKDYGISIVFGANIWGFICLLPTLIIASKVLGGTIFQGIALAFLITMFRFIGEAFHLFVFEKKNIILCKKYIFVIIYCVLMLAVAYVPVVFHVILPIDKYLLNPVVMLIILISGIASISYILNYKLYYKAFNSANKLTELFLDEYKLNEIKFEDVKIDEKEFEKSELNSKLFDNKEGYEYLNAIFFKRHKKLLYKPMFIELIIIVILFAISFIAQIIVPSFMHKFFEGIYNIFPGLVFIMYMLSNSKRITKAMFYNCDISLLRYGFYRDKKVILENFKIRLFKVAFINLIPALVLSASLTILVIMSGAESFIRMIPMVFMILILSLFFSVHDLFLYYILQPYTTELKMKSPYFGIINGVAYWGCYLCLKIKTPPTYFVWMVLAITIAYIIIALYSVYRFSPKTFRVK